MPLTIQEKEKCSALFELYSGERYPLHKWDDKAAAVLAEMVDRLSNCTLGIASLYAVIPKPYELRSLEGIKEWLMRVPVDLIEAKAKVEKGMISKVCADAGLDLYIQLVKIELMN